MTILDTSQEIVSLILIYIYIYYMSFILFINLSVPAFEAERPCLFYQDLSGDAGAAEVQLLQRLHIHCASLVGFIKK